MIDKSDISWPEAIDIIIQHIVDKIIEIEIQEENLDTSLFCDTSMFASLKEQALISKDCNDPEMVSEILMLILQCLDICKFDKKIQIGNNFFLRGNLSDKNFLIEISEED